MSESADGGGVMDMRRVRPHESHGPILRAFDGLAVGQAIEVVTDHRPLPLYHQFASIRRDRFLWEWLQSGPDVWRVRICRIEADAEALG